MDVLFNVFGVESTILSYNGFVKFCNMFINGNIDQSRRMQRKRVVAICVLSIKQQHILQQNQYIHTTTKTARVYNNKQRRRQ